LPQTIEILLATETCGTLVYPSTAYKIVCSQAPENAHFSIALPASIIYIDAYPYGFWSSPANPLPTDHTETSQLIFSATKVGTYVFDVTLNYSDLQISHDTLTINVVE
jgi:hypothetical protein